MTQPTLRELYARLRHLTEAYMSSSDAQRDSDPTELKLLESEIREVRILIENEEDANQ